MLCSPRGLGFSGMNMSNSPPQDGNHEGIEDVEDTDDIEGFEGIVGFEGIMGIQGIMVEDVSDDSEGETYAGQWGVDFDNVGAMYAGQWGFDFANEVEELYDGQWGVDFEEWEDELGNDDDEWEEEIAEGWGIITFQRDVKNVEFPVSNVELPVSLLAGRSEVTKPKLHTKYDPHLMLYRVGHVLGDEGSSSAAGTVVEAMVLPTLPEEAVEAVLLRLPPAEQTRFRAVCKAWLAMLTSSQFLQRSFLLSLAQTTTPPLCAFRYCPEQEYKPHMENFRQVSPLYNAWKVDLSFLPEVFLSDESELHNCSPSGLMCISRLVDEGTHVCVLNPVNQSFRVLPMLQKLWGSHVVLLMGSSIDTATESMPSFKVYVSWVGPASNNDFRLFKDVAIYSSISGQWKGFKFVGLDPHVETTEPPVWACNGDVYTRVDSNPPQLVRLSTEAGPGYLWHLALPRFTTPGGHWQNMFSLVGYRGRLLCCCGGIWMLDDAGQQWVKIAGSCPRDILQPHLPPNPQIQPLTLKSVNVAGDLVVFFYLLPFDVERPVAYDMLRGVWRKVPQSVAQAGDMFQPMPNLRL